MKKTVKAAVMNWPFLFAVLKAIKTAAARIPHGLFQELSFLIESFRIIRSFDLLIISGGGQLLDSWGGPWKFPYTIFKWVLLAKLSRVKCYFINVGAGPLDHPLGRWFVNSALGLADYVSFRDDNSRELVQRVGFRGESHVSADCVYALDPPAPSTRVVAAQQENPIVGLSPMAYCDPRNYWQKDQVIYDRLLRNVTSFGEWLVRNDYHVTLFSTDIWFDLQTIEELKTRLEVANKGMRPLMVKQEQIRGTEDLLSRMGSMDYIVTCRYHGVVFAHLLNKPVLALSHHPKVRTLMNDLGLAPYCLDIRKCDVNALQETFLSLVANQEEIRSRMAYKGECYKRSLTAQFDRLFPQGTTI